MKNPFASFLRSLLEPFRPPRGQGAVAAVCDRRRQEHQTLSRDDFRELLLEALEDPATARALARRLALPAFPLQGGAPDNVTSSGGTEGYLPRFTGDFNIENSVVFQDANGKVGIGTVASPQSQLHVYGANTEEKGLLRLQNSSGSADTFNGVDFQHYTLPGYLQAYIRDEILSGWPTKLHFGTASGVNNATTRMTIDPNGKVGVGTVDPGVELEVALGTSPAIRAIGSGNPMLRADSTTNSVVTKLQSVGSSSLGLVGTQSNHDFAVYTNNLARVTVKAGGDVGIGTASPQAKLDVAGGINASGSVVIGGTTTKQASGGPEKLSFQDADADKVCIANFVGSSEEYARFLLDMKGNMEWAGPSDVDQNVLLGWAAVGRLNCQGIPQPEGGFWIVSWKNSTLAEEVDGTETVIDVTDASQFTTVSGKNIVRCENELMEVTAIDLVNNRLTVTRGVDPSQAATHSNGTLITSLGQPEAHPRIGLNFAGSTIKFSDGKTAADAFISRPAAGRIYIEGDALVAKSGGKVGFYGTTPITKPTVTGSRGGNAALASLLSALSQLGLIVDNTSA